MLFAKSICLYYPFLLTFVTSILTHAMLHCLFILLSYTVVFLLTSISSYCVNHTFIIRQCFNW